ncbi:hypothetical protein [Rathayibacter oskolensis]
MPLHAQGEAPPGTPSASMVPSAVRAATSRPSATRSTAWWW